VGALVVTLAMVAVEPPTAMIIKQPVLVAVVVVEVGVLETLMAVQVAVA
jgi:hypothetical protein